MKCMVLSGMMLVVSLSVMGCNSDPMPAATVEPSVPASGVLLFKGKPLPQYQVVLMPEGGRRPAIGVSDAEGKFTLGTNEPGDGAPPGKSKVAVNWAPPSTGDEVDQSAIDDPRKMPKPEIKIPNKYGNPETSGIELEIPAKGTQELRIELE